MRAVGAFLVSPLAAGLLLLSTGCTRTETYPVRYWLPIAGNSQGPDAPRNCAATCRIVHGDDTKGFFQCLELCPDIRIARDAVCGDSELERPPIALCYTRLVEHQVFDPETTAAVLELVGRIAIATAEVADAVSHDQHHHRSASSSGGHAGGGRHHRRAH
jgi:hypothetical protein